MEAGISVTVAGAETDPATSGAPAVRSFKVLTINTHKGFGHWGRRFILPELRDAIRSVGADLVFLQEVHGAHDHHARRFPDWPATSQYEFLADTIWTDFAYGRNAVYPHGHHGNAVLSKFPIAQHRNLDVSIHGCGENRGLLHCEVELPGTGMLHAICVHLGLGEAERQAQLRLLSELVAGLPARAPVVVAGDFNDWRVRAGTILAGSGLEEAFERAHGVAARSFPAIWPRLRLDRIYVRNLRTLRPEVLTRRPWSRLSDHAPLMVEVGL